MSALFATFSMAAADVSFKGTGRVGVVYNEENKNVQNVDKVNLNTRLRLQFNMLTQSDAGVVVSAQLRAQADQGNGKAESASWNGGVIGVGLGAVQLEFGNISGAIDDLPNLNMPTPSIFTGVTGLGSSGLDLVDVDGYSSTGSGTNNGVNFKYSMGPLGLHVSHSGTGADDERTAANVKYNVSGFKIAVGAQRSESKNDKGLKDENIFVATLGGDLGFMEAGVGFSQSENIGVNDADVDKVRVYGKIPLGAATNLLLWAADEDENVEMKDNGSLITNDGGSFGVDVSHNLGGGVTFVAGFADNSDGYQEADAGILFEF
ncbi:MAG: porin [Aestuariivita sp.]|nr:porin [Aestuariivita sp.]